MSNIEANKSVIDNKEPIKLGALPLVLSAMVTIAYFSFILAIALNKPLMGAVLFPGVSVGVLSAVMLLALCVAVSGAFVAVDTRDEECA
jgi:uncharacterized membrane protein (DUF485 family)